MDSYYSMNALDHLLWAIAALLAVRKRWVPLGVALGIGLLNKASMLWFGAGFGVYLLAFDRAALKTRGPHLAAGIAFVLFLPNVIWQWANGFPTAEFARNAMAEKYVHLSLVDFLHETTMSMNPFSLPLDARGRDARVSVAEGAPRRDALRGRVCDHRPRQSQDGISDRRISARLRRGRSRARTTANRLASRAGWRCRRRPARAVRRRASVREADPVGGVVRRLREASGHRAGDEREEGNGRGLHAMPYENHKPVYIGRGMKRTWPDLWPDLKHYE